MSCPECGRDDVACAVLTASGVSPCAVARWRRLEAERDEARAEAERLRETARQLLQSWAATREMLRRAQAAVRQARAQRRVARNH